jgi:holo-[acyl-carrier protein] synthase
MNAKSLSPHTAVETVWSDVQACVHDGSVSGVGIDLVSVPSVADLITSGGVAFVNACWTRDEQRDSDAHPEGLSARWAAKEAAMKALGIGLGQVSPLEFEICTDESGAPSLRLTGSAQEWASRRGVSGWRISISHEEGWAVAVVVAMKRL